VPSTILIVDDHPITREPLARLLRYEGFETRCAGNGVEALAAMRTSAPDLVLLDVVMPKMNGVDFLQAVRDEPRWRDIPVIALTGSMEPNLSERLATLGVADVLSKARFSVDELLGRIYAYVPAFTRG
jgi:CheY-like chemotaxis protein